MAAIERDAAADPAPPIPEHPLPLSPAGAPPAASPRAAMPLTAELSEDGLATLTAAVIEQTTQTRQRLSSLAEAIEDIAGRFSVQVDEGAPRSPTAPPRPGTPGPVEAPVPTDARAEATPAAPSPSRAAAPSPRRGGGFAMTVAADMARSGARRGAVEATLRSLYDIVNPGPALDAVYGEGTGPEAVARLDD